MVRYGSLAYLAMLLQFLNYRVDYWIVQHFRGDEALGLYSLASSLAMMLWMLPRAAASVLLPATAAGRRRSHGSPRRKNVEGLRWLSVRR